MSRSKRLLLTTNLLLMHLGLLFCSELQLYMEAVGYTCTVASITFGVLSTLNGANAERLVRDFAILISCMVGLDESLCFGEKNVFPVCNYKSSKDIYILMITI